MPAYYECQRCTACCRWPGQVRIASVEIARIARHLELTEPEFIERHTRLRLDRKGLSLMEKANGECEFLCGSGCGIQAVKPQQCCDFPNLWRFPGFDDACHAVRHDISPDEWQHRTKAATGRNTVTRQS